MIVDPVQSAITAFKDVDGIFRQSRLDKERLDQQKFQNDMATAQDQRAQETQGMQRESHKLQIDQDARQRQQETLQALRYKLTTDPATLTEEDFQIMSKDPKISRYLTQPDMIVRDLKVTADLHNDVPKLLGVPKLLAEAPDEASKQALIKDSGEAKKRIMGGLTLLGKDRLVANPENSDGEIQNLLMTEKGLVIEGRFTKKDGKSVVAPLTEGRSSNGEDPVNFYNIKDIMTNITGNAKMLAGLKTALESRGVELGDKKLLDKAENASEGAAVSAKLKEFSAANPNATPEELRANGMQVYAQYPGQAHVAQQAGAAVHSVFPDKKEKPKQDIREKNLGGDKWQQVIINNDGTEKPWGGVYSKRVAIGGMEGGSTGGKAESAFVSNFWKSYTLPAEPGANKVTPIDKTNHARVEYLLNEGANRGVQMVQLYDPVASKYTAMPAAMFAAAAQKAGVKAKKDQFGVINLVGRQNAMNALLNATGNKGAYPVSVMHPAYVQSTRQQGMEINDARLTKLNADIANTP
ncbi:MAG: hypothetical protein ACOYL3_07010 [Desulfuromonadaceae bacterium]